ncbi:MAG: CPBP family intramembrane metalloprotease [Candidatus Cloacimonetes bacterium]|nr:CPBP family intramembrane metalloprotease [Candidatus Cloacimonadota bacterium]
MKLASTKSSVNFFIITFLLTLPGYVLCGLASNNIFFSEEMAISFIALSAIAPIGAALILTHGEKKKGNIKKLLKRSFDYKKITQKIWFLPILFLLPLLFAIALTIMIFTDYTIPVPMFPITAIPVLFFSFFIMALGEEIGWMGYVFKPMQNQLGTFKATLLLGLIWAIWHIPFYIFLMGDPIFIIVQCLSLFSLRFIFVWIFNHTGESVFAMIVFHTVYNVTNGVFPNYQVKSPAGVIITTIIVFLTALIIYLFWHPRRDTNKIMIKEI